MALTIVEITPDHWRDVEQLFGPNGACGGCWCMWWRIEKGERWDDVKGPTAKRRSKKLVQSGKARGVLAYDGGKPAGWCAFGPRIEFSRLDRSSSFTCDDADRVWSLPCFFVKRRHRGHGVARNMLDVACTILRHERAEIIEGYPTCPNEIGQRSPDTFVFTGMLSMFEKSGFKPVENKEKGKIRLRRLVKKTKR